MMMVPSALQRKSMGTASAVTKKVQPQQQVRPSSQQQQQPTATNAPPPQEGRVMNTYNPPQNTYRDEYDPFQPNDYEAFCVERENLHHQEQLKLELEERNRQ